VAADAPRTDASRRREVTLPRYRQLAEPSYHAPPLAPPPRRRVASAILVGVIVVAAIVVLAVLFLLVRGS
jgi:hypothetical protein